MMLMRINSSIVSIAQDGRCKGNAFGDYRSIQIVARRW